MGDHDAASNSAANDKDGLFSLSALERLTGLGHRRAALAVVEQNEAARRFYAAMGGVEVDCFTDPGPLWRSSNVLVAWELGPT